MLSHNPLLKTHFYCLVIIIHLLVIIQTCIAKKCPPSSCGNIPNISYPFRLTNHPKNCGHSEYKLTCENNTTLIYFDSHKYIVREINYPNQTIRVADASIAINDSCSFPNSSISRNYYTYAFPYSILSYRTSFISFISFMSCPYPVVLMNMSHLLEADARCGPTDYAYGRFNESVKRYTYIKLGELNGSYVMDNCTIDLITMTSLPLLMNTEKASVTLSEIHSSLIYGFELSWSEGYLFLLGIFLTIARWTPVLLIVFGVMLHLALRIIIGMPFMLGLIIYKLRTKHLSAFDIIEGFLRSNNNLMPIRYSYSDIKKMTRGFRDKLGQGGYGSVYKGKLRSGHIVAIKLLNSKRSTPNDNGQDFINEVSTIGRIHHVNVVKLVGYCAERSKRALVYDFMPNGSLEKYIFSNHQVPNNPLSWERKYEIAIGVARGIEYLHRGCDIQILHFDIKPHNILLDDNFSPKISDFGLAKFYSTENTTVTLTAARGTIGYVAPELINRSIGSVSYKADVYSFGMLLMEMVGLKRQIIANDEESSKYFPYWIYDRFDKGKDIETGDYVKDDVDDDDGPAKRITKKMTIVGLWCIQMSPVDRPSMSEVVKMLEIENVNLQIPPRPSDSNQNIGIGYNLSDETWGTDESSGSMALLGDCGTSSAINKGGDCIEMSHISIL